MYVSFGWSAWREPDAQEKIWKKSILVGLIISLDYQKIRTNTVRYRYSAILLSFAYITNILILYITLFLQANYLTSNAQSTSETSHSIVTHHQCSGHLLSINYMYYFGNPRPSLLPLQPPQQVVNHVLHLESTCH